VEELLLGGLGISTGLTTGPMLMATTTLAMTMAVLLE